MRLAISNIAWDISEDDDVVQLLKKFDVDAIDVAPGKYFPAPASAKEKDISRVKQWWYERGIEITGMQALLFGTNGLNVFGAANVQEALLGHLEAVCRIGAGLGAKRLVFGSPKNRDRSGLSDDQALNEAVDFFRRLGDIAQAQGVIICLEPNPVCYGANFMTTSAETAHVVRAVDHQSIRMQFDTGALAINAESAEAVLADNADLIGHVHASEPGLLPLGDGGADHLSMYQALLRHLPDHVVSIEMVATKEEPHLRAMERALSCAVSHYRPQKDAL
ncbi:sugar phosphate isomerase/epimerase family protein [Chitiniphilus eburneus]|uniref:Sugar phosphate isomerase/epimerase n=1 Tax=Chitiniphilus eburneus TaxID=2571148 RepID=A0A4U0QBI9_9NEIS|nr:sugar phosphate isomerase/epimerase family protein [Chitiniphilus eburneus]TJZ78761.1 sugar phosphate isomerase/epimerase [Chitiniphilus eburneus]